MAFEGLGGPFQYGLAGKKGPFTKEGRNWMKDLFMGTPGSIQPMPSFSPEQMQLLGQLVSGLSGGDPGGGAMGAGMQNLTEMLQGGPEAMAKFEQPYISQFQQQTVPQLAERFSGLGAGAQGSSAFGQQLGQAGAGLSESLASLRGNLQQGAMSQLQGLLGMGMQSPFQYMQIPGQEGALSKLLGGVGSGLGQAGGMAGMAKLLPLLGL